MQKISYLCDAGKAQCPCRKETRGYYIVITTGHADAVRFDLCDYHAEVLSSALRGDLKLPRDPAEAACP